MKPIIFWGASGHARVLREFIGELGYELVALFDNDESATSPFPDVRLYYGPAGFSEWKEGRMSTGTACLVAIGAARCRDRLEIQRFLQDEGIEPIIAVHPTAFVADSVKLSKGCQVLAGTCLCADVVLGEACIINTASSVDHECRLGEGVFVAPGATLAGCVTVGDRTLIGAGAVVLPWIKIGSDVIIGAGSVVTRDIPDGKIAYGNPARVRRDSSPPKDPS